MARNEERGVGAIAFKSGALPEDKVVLWSLHGRERLSSLYEFDLVLDRATAYTEEQMRDLLKAPCAVAMGEADGEVVHGLLSSIELLDGSSTVSARYRATLVPGVWLLTLARTNRLFQKVKVAAMVEQILTLYGLAKGTDFEIAAWDKGPEREYIVQYEESDWDFIQRWLEHEGYFYWFEHQASGEKLVIKHASSSCPPIPGNAAVPFRDRNDLGASGSTILEWRVKEQRIAARVLLSDYNYRRPTSRVVAKADADKDDGFGSVFLHGEHFKDQGEGDALAKVRAERLACEKKTIRGATDCARFRVGHTFQLENHFMADQDGDYLITAIVHRAGRWGDVAGGDRYRAQFAAIPKKVPFRPERLTPWPRIVGVMHAHIDGDAAGTYAQIDDLGRYRVKLPFDGSGSGGSGASRWIRMAQHYSGPGYGSHFPLHKGSEVILAHVDGNPDRPIIVSSVPNPATLSPSTSQNATQSVIHTASGIRIEMEDLQK
jgi:type VI secretion system secreted protein VgrG